MPATRRPPTAAAARPGVAACGWWPEAGPVRPVPPGWGYQPPPHLYPAGGVRSWAGWLCWWW